MPDLPIYYKCNNKCIMCTNPDDYKKLASTFDLRFMLKRLKLFHSGKDLFLNNYRDAFNITGGEPTLSPHLFSIIKKIKLLFPDTRISLLTNGRLFHYSNYVQNFLTLADNLELVIPLHGHNALLHDKITAVKGSFKQTVRGLKNIFNLRKKYIPVEIRVVVHGLNYKYLSAILGYILREFPMLDRLVLIFFEVEGMAKKNLNFLKLKYSEVKPYINNILNDASYFKDFRLYHFPLCSLDRKAFAYAWRTLPSAEVMFPDFCRKCALRKYCLGIHKTYVKSFGCTGFRPYKSVGKIRETGNWYQPIS